MLKKLITAAAASLMILGAAAIMPAETDASSATGGIIVSDAASYDISGFRATIPYSSYTYRGRGIKPTVTVKDGSGRKLTKDVDFTVTYSDNVNVGMAKITIRGKGRYTGTLNKTFTVKALDLSSSYAKITIPYSSYTYSGSAIKPEVKVKFKSGDIIPSTQYKLSYTDNVKVGTATITVKGKGGNVTGSYKKTFVVKPAKNSIKSLTAGSSSFKLTWSKATPGATGYQVLYSTDKNFVNNVHSYTSTDLNDLSENFSKVPKAGETWYVKVRSFVTKDGRASSTRYGNYSAVKSVTLGGVPSKPVGKGYVDYTYQDVDNDGVKELIEVYDKTIESEYKKLTIYRIYNTSKNYYEVDFVNPTSAMGSFGGMNTDRIIYNGNTGTNQIVTANITSHGMNCAYTIQGDNINVGCFIGPMYEAAYDWVYKINGVTVSRDKYVSYIKKLKFLYSYLDPQGTNQNYIPAV